MQFVCCIKNKLYLCEQNNRIIAVCLYAIIRQTATKGSYSFYVLTLILIFYEQIRTCCCRC